MSEQDHRKAAEVTHVSDDEIRAITAAIAAEDTELLERLARNDGPTPPE